jgi:prevent-host-death family protein
METISISKFKATCLALLERVRQTGEPILVTKRGVPIAQIDPPPSEQKRKITYGAMKGRIKILGDIVGPISSEEEWDAGR